MARTTKKPATKKSTVKTQPSADAIAAENAALKARVAELEAATKQKKDKKKQGVKNFWRAFFVVFSVTIAATCFMLFTLSYWTKTTLLDTDKFVAATSPIISDQAVQQTLTTEITTKIFEKIDVEKELQAALPENVQFIAGPLAGQIESFTKSSVARVLASPQVATAWTDVLATTQSTLVAYIQNPNADGKITVDDLYTTAGKELQNTSVGFLFNKNLPSSVGNFTLREISWLPQVRAYIDALSRLTNVLLLVSLVATIVALAVTRRRRLVVTWLASLTIVYMGAVVGALYIGSQQTAKAVEAQYSAAAESVYQIITASLKEQSLGILALGVAILVVMFVTSHFESITKLRMMCAGLLDKVFGRILKNKDFVAPGWLVRLADNKVVIGWTLTIAFFVVFALRFPPTRAGVNAALIGSAIVASLLALVASVVRVSKKHA
jgi:hypothetical protein